MEVGNRISFFRIQKGMSVNKLANKAGVSQSYLRSIELGEKNPTVEFLSYICDALEITLAEFFEEDTENKYRMDPILREFYSLSDKQRQCLYNFIHSMRHN